MIQQLNPPVRRLPNLLVNRLFLNLRSFNPNSTSAYSTTSSLVFARDRFLGNIGAPLNPWRSFLKDSDYRPDEEGESSGLQVDGITVGMRAGGDNTTLIPVVSRLFSALNAQALTEPCPKVYLQEDTQDIELVHIQREPHFVANLQTV